MTTFELSHRSRLDQFAVIGQSIRRGVFDPIMAPIFDGRVPGGDQRSADLKAAITDVFAAVDRLEAVARKDLEWWVSAERAETRNREAHERDAKERQI